MTGSSLVGAAVRVPRVKNKNLLRYHQRERERERWRNYKNYYSPFLCSILFCEAAAIYGIILALTLTSRLNRPEIITYSTRFTGYTYFWSGLTVGFSNLICGVVVGLVGSGLVLADAENSTVFVRVLVVEIFASAIVLIGLIIGLMQIISATDF